MTHASNEEWMAYLYGELDQQKRAALETHVKGCPDCEAKLASWGHVMDELDTWQLPGDRVSAWRLSRVTRLIGRWAVAAALLIAAGYIGGRLSAPQPPDIEQLRVALVPSLRWSLEPAIRRDVIAEVNRQWRPSFERSCVQLKDELHQQVRRDLTEFAARTLAASGTLLDQRLTELVQLIETALAEDRYMVTATLEQMELDRLQDKSKLRDGLKALFAAASQVPREKQD